MELKLNTMEQLNKMNYVPQVNKPMQESMEVHTIEKLF